MYKDIPWYEWRYAISEEWIVISLLNKHKVLIDGNIVETPLVRAVYYDKNGYPRVSLRWKKSRAWWIHQLVMMTFVGPYPSNDHVINHKDWNVKNFCLDNLEYVTSLQNTRYKNPLKKMPSGEKHHWWMKRWKLSKLSMRVWQYENWILIKEHDSLWECSRNTWFNISNIWSVIYWKQKTCHWYTFKYL